MLSMEEHGSPERATRSVIDRTVGPNVSGARYEIRVRGALSETLLLAFPEFAAEIRDGQTQLLATLPDQSALHGALSQVEALGLQLLLVRRCS